jgi:hypothetical protein
MEISLGEDLISSSLASDFLDGLAQWNAPIKCELELVYYANVRKSTWLHLLQFFLHVAHGIYANGGHRHRKQVISFQYPISC